MYAVTMNMRIGVAGDWHGNTPWAVERLNDFHAESISIIMQLGDFGIWHDERGTEFLTQVNQTLLDNGQVLLVTLGNHENYEMVGQLDTLPFGEYEGWQFNAEFPNILYATRGQRWEWAGVSFVSLGGAHSINRYDLMEGVDWWAGESMSYGDIMRTLSGGHADVFVAHDCPTGVELFSDHRDDSKWQQHALEYAYQSRDDLRIAVDGVKPGLLFHGHYHHYINTVTDLTDDLGESYQLHSIGLDKDNDAHNIGILHLPSKEFTLLN